jgi:hypothetical protein
MMMFKGWEERRHDLKAYRIALHNFTYVADYFDEWTCFDRIDEPFCGDCEDLAFTLQKQIGGDVWLVRYEGHDHAVLVKNGYVFDQFGAVKRKHYRGEFIKTLIFDDKPQPLK